MPTTTPAPPRAIDTAAALVTACLQDAPDRRLIDTLLDEADEAGYLRDLTAALAFGFAANVEGIAVLSGHPDPRDLWAAWCHQEQAGPPAQGRPFRRPS